VARPEVERRDGRAEGGRGVALVVVGEEIELAAVELLLLDRLLDLGQQVVDRVRLALELLDALLPRGAARGRVTEAEDLLLQLDEAVHPELVPVVLGGRAVEVVERRLEVAAVVEQVPEVDARLDVVGVELQGTAQRGGGAVVVAQPVQGVADAGHRLGVLGLLARGHLEELARLLDQPLAEEGAADLEHELDVVLVAQLEGAAEGGERLVAATELEQHLAEPGQRVLVLVVHGEGVGEGAAAQANSSRASRA
jgi:hypothetical protein